MNRMFVRSVFLSSLLANLGLFLAVNIHTQTESSQKLQLYRQGSSVAMECGNSGIFKLYFLEGILAWVVYKNEWLHFCVTVNKKRALGLFLLEQVITE